MTNITLNDHEVLIRVTLENDILIKLRALSPKRASIERRVEWEKEARQIARMIVQDFQELVARNSWNALIENREAYDNE